MWCASLLACGAKPDAPVLAQTDLESPQAISQWLKAHRWTADRTFANAFLPHAHESARKQNWGPAGKGFCESAMHYPAPQSLRWCADASLHVYGPVRVRTGETFKEKSDLAGALCMLDSASAADAVLNELSPADKSSLEQDRTCLQAYLNDQLDTARADACAPIAAYRNLDRPRGR